MAKDTKSEQAEPEAYGTVVQRLEGVVARLESGNLSLEDSLTSFEEGIRLVRKGEQLLQAAEQRVEQLLSVDGKETVAPLELPARPSVSSTTKRASVPLAGSAVSEDDVPF